MSNSRLVKKCIKCGTHEGQIGMVENGEFITDVNYWRGRGSLQAEPVTVRFNNEGVCNLCTNNINVAKTLIF